MCLALKYRYFFYVTNDRDLTAHQIVEESNLRCNQENLIEQHKNGVRALHAPLNNLEANWSYMVMSSLAWSLKAWAALLLPVEPRWRDKHQAEQDDILRMDFRTFLQQLIMVPAQIVRSGRRIIFRVLAWRPQLPVLFRLFDAL
ncbi:MAG: transposase [Nitrospira sp.]|nr:transposase [Nitrospira sp.]